MTTEELLKPRYLVENLWPFAEVCVGEILTPNEDGLMFVGAGKVVTETTLKSYPYLIRKLEWWEERKYEEIPEYVKHGENGKPRKVKRIFRDELIEFDGGRIRRLNSKYLPASKEEYEAYINQK